MLDEPTAFAFVADGEYNHSVTKLIALGRWSAHLIQNIFLSDLPLVEGIPPVGEGEGQERNQITDNVVEFDQPLHIDTELARKLLRLFDDTRGFPGHTIGGGGHTSSAVEAPCVFTMGYVCLAEDWGVALKVRLVEVA